MVVTQGLPLDRASRLGARRGRVGGIENIATAKRMRFDGHTTKAICKYLGVSGRLCTATCAKRPPRTLGFARTLFVGGPHQHRARSRRRTQQAQSPSPAAPSVPPQSVSHHRRPPNRRDNRLGSIPKGAAQQVHSSLKGSAFWVFTVCSASIITECGG